MYLVIIDRPSEGRDKLVRSLRALGCRVLINENADALTSVLALGRPEAVALELAAEGTRPTIQLCTRVRAWSQIPLLVMAWTVDEATTIRLLDAGADAVLNRPFGADVLLAQVRAIRRRGPGSSVQALHDNPTFRIKDLTIDLDQHTVSLRGEPIHLTRKEFDVLRRLAQAQGNLVTHEQLTQELWADGLSKQANIRTLIKQLRQKLGDDSQCPAYLLSEPGLGYRLNCR